MTRSAGRDMAIVAWQTVGAFHDAAALLLDAPRKFSATSLIVWLYAGAGYVLEDDLLALHRSHAIVIGSLLESGDLVFRSGRGDRFHVGRDRLGVAHVGVWVGHGIIIHASPFHGRVVPSPIDRFLNADEGKYRGVRRVFAC